MVENASCSTYSVILIHRHHLLYQPSENTLTIIMTSTTNTAHPTSSHSYLKASERLDDAELRAENARIRRSFSEPAVEVDGGMMQGLRFTDVETLAKWCDNNYKQQQNSRKISGRNSERSAREAVSQGAGDSFEACADLQTSKDDQATTISTTK